MSLCVLLSATGLCLQAPFLSLCIFFFFASWPGCGSGEVGGQGQGDGTGRQGRDSVALCLAVWSEEQWWGRPKYSLGRWLFTFQFGRG